MNRRNILSQRWREMSITTKFSAAFGLLLFLILLVSITSYFALTAVRRQTERAILTSTEIQRLVLEMDAGLERARRLEKEFFSSYETVGFEEARRTYVQQTSEQIGQVVVLSAQLQQLIAQSDVSQALQESNVNLNFYLSASGRYMAAFEEAVELTAQLAASDTGLQAQLAQKSASLRDTLQTLDGADLMLLYHEMQSLEKDYRITGQRSVMQSAFNVAFALRQAIEAMPDLEEKQKAQALADLDDYVSVAEEILDLDVAIRSKFREFDLQTESIDPVSAELIALAGDEVERARTRIDQASRFATTGLLVAALTGVVLTGLIAIVLNNSITRNVIKLTDAAAELQAGNMKVRTQVESGDEIGLLATTFNQMAAQLQTLYTSLEQQVISRTERLQKQAVELAQAKERAEEARRAAESSAQAALEAQHVAEAASRAKSAFLANMSHELRTPLNAILGFTQLMRRDPAFPSAQQDNLRIVHRSGEHLLELINDVLEMSKIEAGRTTFTESDFDLYQLLATLESMFAVHAEEKGLQFGFECAPDVPQYIRTDERKLHQTLINLLGNAVKFTEQGSVTLRVRCCDEGRGTKDESSPAPGHSSLVFEVQDTGAGIAPEEMDQLFEAFTQTASGQEVLEGTGLGLALSRRFVQLMGGDITVESPPSLPPSGGEVRGGPGSLFHFDIQMTVVEAGAVQTRQPTRRVVGLAPGQPAYRILVVEDREASRALLVELLTAVGFEVREAVNGQEALDVWQAWEPHLVWMDMRMPVMDGYEATKRIRISEFEIQPKDRAKPRTPIIALTAHAFEKERTAIVAAGCDDLVRKPFQESEIFDKMAQHLGVRYVYEELAPSAAPDGALQAQAELTPADLATLPADWVADLRQAAIRGKSRQILDLLDQLPPDQTALAEALAQLVYEFRFDKLVALTEQ